MKISSYARSCNQRKSAIIVVMSARFQASAVKQMRIALLWVVTQRVMDFCIEISGQTIGPILRVQETKSFGFFNPEDGTDKSSRNVGKNYHYSLRNNPEECSYGRHVCLSKCIRAVATGHIFVKFDTGHFYEILPRNPNFVKIGRKCPSVYMKTEVCF